MAGDARLLPRNPWVPRRPLTVAEYHRMGEAGILTEDDRVEPIEGKLIALPPVMQSDRIGCFRGSLRRSRLLAPS